MKNEIPEAPEPMCDLLDNIIAIAKAIIRLESFDGDTTEEKTLFMEQTKQLRSNIVQLRHCYDDQVIRTRHAEKEREEMLELLLLYDNHGHHGDGLSEFEASLEQLLNRIEKGAHP